MKVGGQGKFWELLWIVAPIHSKMLSAGQQIVMSRDDAGPDLVCYFLFTSLAFGDSSRAFYLSVSSTCWATHDP